MNRILPRRPFFTLCGFALLMLATSASAQSPRIVGYYPSWNSGVLPHSAIRYDLLTNIVHAFIFPNGDGTLDLSGFSLYPALIQSAHEHGVKVSIALGGWDAVRTPQFSQMAANATARTAFVSNVKAFCRANGYDGADLDWEYPKTEADKANFTALVHELRAAFDFDEPHLLLSMAGPAGWWGGQWFDFAAVQGDFDWIGMMTYDFYGAWTPKAGPNSALYSEPGNTEGWADNSVAYYRDNRAVAAGKLMLGVPFYGQQFTAASLYGASTAATQVTYRNIVPKLAQGWTRTWNATGRYPVLQDPQRTLLITYDDSVSMVEKASFLRAKSLGGVIIWALGQDEISGSQPLLETLVHELQTVVRVPDNSSMPASFELEQNYPNPFNEETRVTYRIGEAGQVLLAVYDLLGRRLVTLADGLHHPGHYSVVLSSRDLSAGVYVYRLSSAGVSRSQRCIVMP